MAGKVATLPAGRRLTDYVGVGLLTKVVPPEEIADVLEKTGRHSKRQRELPAQIIVYYVIALALYMQVSYREVMRCLLEGLQWLFGPQFEIKIVSKSSISEARTKLGYEPIKLLHDKLVKPVASKVTRGAFYRIWQVVSLDGSVFDVADTKENEIAFGRPGANQGISAYPQIKFVSLVETGTHVLFASHMGGYRKTSEQALAHTVVKSLSGGMLCIADRLFYGFKLWQMAKDTGAALLWRIKDDLRLRRERELPDGSYLSRVYDPRKDRQKKHGTVVRVIEFTITKENGGEENYRLITTILDHEQAPALELAALYQERWEIETALDEVKTHLRGATITLRSKTPNLVRQEFYGFMLAHYAIRGLMHEAALKVDVDPDRLSYTHSKRVILRKLPQFAAFPPGAMAISS